MLKAAGTALLFTVLTFAVGCGGDEASNPSAEETAGPETTEQASTTEETEPSAEDSMASVGETITVGNVRWTVTEAQQLDRIVSRLGSEEGNFVVVDVSFTNNANQDVILATPFVTLVDNEGREFEADQDRNFTHLDPEKNMFVGQVKPGSTREGRIIFSVAPDSSGIMLKVGDGTFASDETGYIDLGL